MMEIRDWFTALEFDVACSDLVQKELRLREIDREKREREFWKVALGREASDTEMYEATDHELPPSDDELIARSMLSRG